MLLTKNCDYICVTIKILKIQYFEFRIFLTMENENERKSLINY